MKKLSAIFILVVSLFFFTNHTEAKESSQLIIINKATNTLAFYRGGGLVKTFKVATGRVSSYTPEGTFKIVNKIKNRPYYTKNIPGGDPNNPLGDRWLGLEARGTYGTTYGIHGNNNESSIGKYVSAGCVRMHNQEIRWLFDQVEVTTPVIITRSNNSFEAIAKANGYEVSGAVNAGVVDNALLNENGWVKSGNKKYYYANGVAKTGWQTIEGARYFFDRSGVMKTGWLTSGEKKYYLNQNGVMQTNWLTINEKKYYLDGSGVMQTGWLEKDGIKYFFATSGEMHTGWLETEGKKYFFDNGGVMRTGWMSESGHRYYLDANGAVTIGWLEADGRKYYFDASGVMQTDWVRVAENWYYLGDTGVMKTGWVNDQGRWYYLNSNGGMESSWKPTDDVAAAEKTATLKRYLSSVTAVWIPGWINYKNNWYYLYVNKDMAVTFIKDE